MDDLATAQTVSVGEALIKQLDATDAEIGTVAPRYKSILEMSFADLQPRAMHALTAALVLGAKVELTCERLPDTPNRVSTFRYTLKLYDKRELMHTMKDLNVHELLAFQLASWLKDNYPYTFAAIPEYR